MRLLEERFWSKVNKTKTCWLWTACKNKYGYGKFGIGKKVFAAHRVSWKLEHGVIPKKKSVLHRCDDPACVRPAHLFLGTQKDNMRDMIRKNRRGYTGLKGTKNPKAKLTSLKVRDIRRLFTQGMLRSDLAVKYKVNWTTIDRIVNKKHWEHVE